jgi:8-oxo-dGTP pyrophosphatase MutT (NUDIX family)
MGRIWQKVTSRVVAHFRVFNLREDIFISPRTGKEFPAFILETGDWISIVPVTPDDQVVMVKQYRFAAEKVTLEIPGGLADLEDISMLEAARRELREETGYNSDDIVHLGTVLPNPAILNNRCHIFYARNVTCQEEQCLDIGEDIEVALLPLEDIPRLIREGVIDHSIVLNAFHLFDLYRQNESSFR